MVLSALIFYSLFVPRSHWFVDWLHLSNYVSNKTFVYIGLFIYITDSIWAWLWERTQFLAEVKLNLKNMTRIMDWFVFVNVNRLQYIVRIPFIWEIPHLKSDIDLWLSTGYTGVHCEVDINECASHPCYFNGTCIDRVSSYECLCQAVFMRERCEAVIRQCPLNNPCGLNAVCVEKPAGMSVCQYTTLCVYSYSK